MELPPLPRFMTKHPSSEREAGMVISDEELSKKPCARVHALRVGVVLRRYELGAVAAKKGEQKVRHGREAAEVLLEAQLPAQEDVEEALEARGVLGEDAHLGHNAFHDHWVPLRKVRWRLVLQAVQSDDELNHRRHVLGICPALVEDLLELSFAREARRLERFAQEAPDVLKTGGDGKPERLGVGAGFQALSHVLPVAPIYLAIVGALAAVLREECKLPELVRDSRGCRAAHGFGTDSSPAWA